MTTPKPASSRWPSNYSTWYVVGMYLICWSSLSFCISWMLLGYHLLNCTMIHWMLILLTPDSAERRLKLRQRCKHVSSSLALRGMSGARQVFHSPRILKCCYESGYSVGEWRSTLVRASRLTPSQRTMVLADPTRRMISLRSSWFNGIMTFHLQRKERLLYSYI